jgi:hypothetical protein
VLQLVHRRHDEIDLEDDWHEAAFLRDPDVLLLQIEERIVIRVNLLDLTLIAFDSGDFFNAWYELLPQADRLDPLLFGFVGEEGVGDQRFELLAFLVEQIQARLVRHLQL